MLAKCRVRTCFRKQAKEREKVKKGFRKQMPDPFPASGGGNMESIFSSHPCSPLSV